MQDGQNVVTRHGPVKTVAMLRKRSERTPVFFAGLIFAPSKQGYCTIASMLQRKQSLFLLLAALLCFATWLFPVAGYERGVEHFRFFTYGLYAADGTELMDVGMKVPFSVLLTVLGVGLLVTIFLYKDRKRQQRFVRSTYLLLLGISVFLFITDNSMRSYLEQGGSVINHLGLSFYLPIVALVLAFLAERSIKADEELVRSVDRLR